ncbi:MAG TPA: thioredoxin family protein [Pyrinomonadaceae bacterium]|jgi:peroxiredoxin
MKKTYAFALALALSLLITTGTALAQAGSGMGQGTGQGTGHGSGTGHGGVETATTVADFTLPDATGKKHSLASLKGEKGTILIFISTQCPVSNAYNGRMEKLAHDYKARGINLVGINANSTESAEDIKAHAEQNDLTFTILKDKGNKVADQLGATNTPEVFFLDANNKLVYRGRIDNSRNGQSISANDLRDAIEATLAGKPVANAFVRAFGCSIKRG